MQTYELLVKERSVRPNSKDMTLVRTSVGIDQVHILFDNVEWLGFPITVTFAQGDDVITIPITVTELRNSEWVAEATVTVPHEVIDMVGAIRVTLQGTDAQGNHIITAKGSPLSVEEAGDVIEGLAPSDAPTVSEWQQAYSDAQVAIGQAQSLVNDLTSRLDEVVEDAIQRISHEQYELPVATDEVLGGVKIGSGISRREDGTIFVTQQESQSQPSQLNARLLARIAEIVDATITATYDDDGISDTSVSHESLPVATMDTLGAVYPDGTSVVVDDDGMIHAEASYIPIATTERTGSVKPDGTSITVDEDGTIHGSLPSQPYELPVATTETLGGVRPDGQSITIDQDGTIHAATPVDIPTKVSDLTNDSGFISEEADPTVPDWAKQASKPTYTADEVGALPDTTTIPSKTSQLINDSGFVTSVPTKTSQLANDSGFITDVPIATSSVTGKVKPDGTSVTIDEDGTIHAVVATPAEESDPTVPSWAKQPNKPTYTAQEVGALPNTTVIPSKTSQLANDSGFVTDVPVATSSVAGKVKPDGSTITIDSDGTLHGSAQVNVATMQNAGIVRPDGTSVIVDSDGTIHAALEASGPHWDVRSIDGRQRLVIVIPEEA